MSEDKNQKSDSKNPISEIAEEEIKKSEKVPSGESILSGEDKDDDDESEEEEEEESEGDEEELRERRSVSCILEDGTLVEMIYDYNKHLSNLAVYKDGKVSIEESVDVGNDMVFLPLSPNQSILENHFVILPSGVEDYKSNEDLYYEVRAFIDKYVKLTDRFLSVVAVYVLMSWVYDKFQNIPYLRCSGLWGTGKSRVLSVAGNICYKAVLVGGSISTAALFRTLNLLNPVLVFDEAELSEKEAVEMRQVLRQGYSKGLPVSRMEKGNNGKMYVQIFNVFGPKIIASQSGFRDAALESRCLTEQMYPMADSGRPIELSKQFHEDALILRNKLLMFRFKNYWTVTADEQALGEIKLPRLKQTGLAVVSVAKILGQQALADILEFLVDYEKLLSNEQTDTVEHDILLCILSLMCKGYIKEEGRIKIGTDLAEEFNRRQYEEYSDRKNSEYRSSYEVMRYSAYKVSPKKIGGHVRRMGLKVERNREGFFIPVFSEYPKIQALSRRYGLDNLYKIPENPTKVSEIKPPKKENTDKKAMESSDKKIDNESKKDEESGVEEDWENAEQV